LGLLLSVTLNVTYYSAVFNERRITRLLSCTQYLSQMFFTNQSTVR